MENNQHEHSPQPTPPPPPSSHSASQVVWPPHTQASYEISDAPSSSQYSDDVDVQVQQPLLLAVHSVPSAVPDLLSFVCTHKCLFPDFTFANATVFVRNGKVEYGTAESSSGVQDYSPNAYSERYQQAAQDSSSQMMRSLPYDQSTSQGSPFSPQPSTSSSTAYQQVRMHPRHRLMSHHHHHHHLPHHLGNVMGSYDRISPVDEYQNSPATSSEEHLRQYESMTQLAEQSDQVSSAIRMSQTLPSQSHVAISLSSARVDSPSVVDRGPSPMSLDRTSAAIQSQRIPSPLTTMANQRISNNLPVPSRYLSSDLVESSMGGHSMSLDSQSQKELLVEAARNMVANQLTGSNHVLSMASQRIPSPINMVVSQSQRIPSPTSMDYSGMHGSPMSLGRIQHVGVHQGQRSMSPDGSVVQNSQRYSPVHLRSMNASPPMMVSTPLAMQNYVSSSTGPMEGNQSSNMVSSGSVLDSAVDSTVETTDSRLGADEVVESSGASYMPELDAGDGTLDNTQVTGVSTTADDLTVDSAASSSIVSSQNGHLTMSDAIDTTDGIDTTVNNNALDSSSTVNKMMQLHSMGLRHDNMQPVISLPNSVSQVMISHHVRMDHIDTIASSRPRRLLHKQRLAEQEQLMRNHSRLLYQTKEFWCEECNMEYDTECTRHRIQMIFDKPVLSRAWASLPGAYLAISKVGIHENGDSVFGVFAKKPIPKRTKFGPVEGVITKLDEVIQEELVLQIEADTGELMHLDTTDEGLSNWMRFVRPAENYREQNLVVIQAEQSLYFFSTRQINPRTELKVGYSLQYAERRGLKILEPDEEELKAMEDQENAWPCFECNSRFSNSEDLQKHLNEHEIGDPPLEDEAAIAAARKKIRPRGRPPKKSKGRHPKKMKVHEDMQVALDTLDEATAEALTCRPRGRPPKKFRVALDTLEEATNQALPQPSKRPRGRPPKKFKVSDLEDEDADPNDRHVRRHKIRGEDQLSRPIKSLFKKKQAEGTEWLCTHCDLTFDNSSLLNLHTLTHAAENVGLEEVARFAVEPEFTIKNGVPEDYKDEFQSELVETPLLKCPQCTQEFLSKKDLIEHASAHGKMIMRRSFRGMINPAKPFKCELCYKSFASEERLLRHNLVHGSEDTKPLQCEICFKRFLNNSALACHIKVHSSDEKKYYECPICKEGFDQIILLKDHVHIHCIDGIYTCPSCQKGFEEYNQIRKHIRAFHSEKRYPCEQCDKVFPRPDKLKLHMLRHSDHREFLCANCGKQFKRKDKLKEHMKRMHSAEREARLAMKPLKPSSSKKFIPKVSPTDYHRFIYKCHSCLLGFKRRGMLVNHLAKRHPDIRPESVPELNLPILKTTRDYYCQYCEKVYKSSSKRKAHIIKNHPGAELPMSNRRKGGIPEIPGLPNPTFSQTVGSITTHPHNCDWCHKQYASKAKLLQHQRKKHLELLPQVESGCFEARQNNFFKVEKDVQALERIDRVQYSCSQQIPRTHHRDLTTQYQVQITTTTQTDSDFADTIVIDASKRKVPTPTPRPPSVYVERDTHTPAIPPHSVENLQAADLLTQAMSELTQTLNEYRSPTSEFHLTRVSHSGPPTIVSTSPSTTPVPQSTTPLSNNTPLEQSQLGQILAHYQSQAAQQGALSPGPPPSPTPSPAPSSYIPRTWTTTFANYPAR